MSNELIRREGLFPILHSQERKLGRELAQQIKRMDAIRVVAEAAMDEVSAVAGYGAFKFANTSTLVDLIHQAAKARGLPSASDATFEWFAQEYGNAISNITHRANTKIVLEVDHVSDRR